MSSVDADGELTAPGSAWVMRRAGCTAYTGTRGTPNWPGSLWQTGGPLPGAAGTRCALDDRRGTRGERGRKKQIGKREKGKVLSRLKDKLEM